MHFHSPRRVVDHKITFIAPDELLSETVINSWIVDDWPTWNNFQYNIWNWWRSILPTVTGSRRVSPYSRRLLFSLPSSSYPRLDSVVQASILFHPHLPACTMRWCERARGSRAGEIQNLAQMLEMLCIPFLSNSTMHHVSHPKIRTPCCSNHAEAFGSIGWRAESEIDSVGIEG